MNGFKNEHNESGKLERVGKEPIDTFIKDNYFSSDKEEKKNRKESDNKIFSDIDEVVSETENSNGEDESVHIGKMSTSLIGDALQGSINLDNLTVSQIPSAPKDGYDGTINEYLKQAFDKPATDKIEEKMVGGNEENRSEISGDETWKDSKKSRPIISSGLYSPSSSQDGMTHRIKHKNRDIDYRAAEDDDTKNSSDNPCDKIMEGLATGMSSCNIL